MRLCHGQGPGFAGLFALLPDSPHRREVLAGLLWPEFPERAARSSLRNALANLRQSLVIEHSPPPFCTSPARRSNLTIKATIGWTPMPSWIY